MNGSSGPEYDQTAAAVLAVWLTLGFSVAVAVVSYLGYRLYKRGTGE